MQSGRIFIENWPSKGLLDFLTIAVSFIALCVSLYSIHFNRKSLIHSSRPYVFALSYTTKDSTGRIVPIPWSVIFQVQKTPAKIIKQKITLACNGISLFEYNQENLIRFPSEGNPNEWSFHLSKSEFERVMNEQTKGELTRTIYFEYSDLDLNENYTYMLTQRYIPQENQWENSNEETK